MWVGFLHVWQLVISNDVAVLQTEHLVLVGKVGLGRGACCFGSAVLLLGFGPFFLPGVFLFVLLLDGFCSFSVSSESTTMSSSRSKAVPCVSTSLSVEECVSALTALLVAAGMIVQSSPRCFCACGTVVLCSVEVFVMLLVARRGLGWPFSLANGAWSVLGVRPWGFLPDLAASLLETLLLLVSIASSNLRLADTWLRWVAHRASTFAVANRLRRT